MTRTQALLNILKTDKLTHGEIKEITRWTHAQISTALSDLAKSGRLDAEDKNYRRKYWLLDNRVG
jgi:predicted HTH transcriptional regulator